jgi:serine protease Do
MQQLLKEGVVHRGYLGVQIKDLTDADLAKRLGVEENGGVLVTQVFEGSPSAKAGLQEGDVITALGGKAIKTGHELQQAVASLPVGKPIDLTVQRDGKSKVLQVTIQEQPREFGASAVPSLPEHSPRHDRNPVSVDKVGLEVSDLTADLADQFGYPDKAKGALITQVERDSAASKAGLRRGMLITKVEKHAVTSARSLRDELDKADLARGALVQVQTPEGASNLVVLKVTE